MKKTIFVFWFSTIAALASGQTNSVDISGKWMIDPWAVVRCEMELTQSNNVVSGSCTSYSCLSDSPSTFAVRGRVKESNLRLQFGSMTNLYTLIPWKDEKRVYLKAMGETTWSFYRTDMTPNPPIKKSNQPSEVVRQVRN